MFLVDANIFLEVILSQDKKEDCKNFLNKNIGKINITDFSLHSICIILLGYSKEDIFQKFIKDVLPNVKILSVPLELYSEIVSIKRRLNLDFDDIYQYSVAKFYKLKLVTMDRDFKKVKDIEIIFI
jgi:predicted nucleic acid-binding protein